MLFSHPADFTPVCTTELGRTAALSGEFAARNAKPIAVSVDSIEDHHRWIPDIAEVAGVPVDFPIIADYDRAVAQAYDMIHPGEGDTSTVRSVFLIDPNDKVRLTITYPKSVGRNFTEILRALDALQATDGAPISTPAEWVPGDRVIVAPTISTADAQERFAQRRRGHALPALRRRPGLRPREAVHDDVVHRAVGEAARHPGAVRLAAPVGRRPGVEQPEPGMVVSQGMWLCPKTSRSVSG